jgi:hypothetical protein
MGRRSPSDGNYSATVSVFSGRNRSSDEFSGRPKPGLCFRRFALPARAKNWYVKNEVTYEPSR